MKHHACAVRYQARLPLSFHVLHVIRSGSLGTRLETSLLRTTKDKTHWSQDVPHLKVSLC